MDSVARGTLINLLTRTAAVALVLAITTITARIGTETQGAFALFTSVEGVLLALLSGFGAGSATSDSVSAMRFTRLRRRCSRRRPASSV